MKPDGMAPGASDVTLTPVSSGEAPAGPTSFDNGTFDVTKNGRPFPPVC